MSVNTIQNQEKVDTTVIHVIVALLCLPGYQYLGDTFKLVVAPYILYMVWSENQAYLPALIIHAAVGSTIAIFILMICFLKTLRHYHTFQELKLTWLVWLMLIPSPILFYQSFNRFFFLHNNFIESVIPLGFYLGIFPFFYGLSISEKVTSEIWKYIMLVTLLLYILSLTDLLGLIRIGSYAFVLFSVIGLTVLIPHVVNMRLNINFRYFGILFIALITIGLFKFKFHTLFSALFAYLVVYFYLNKNKSLLSMLVKPRIIILVTAVTIFVAISSHEYGNFGKKYQDFSYSDPSKYPEFIQYKAFSDRGVIWSGVWDIIKKRNHWLPPYELKDYTYITATGSTVEDVSYGAHNIVLELLRNYGYIVGAIISIGYIVILILLGRIFRTTINNHNIIILAASNLGLGIVAGATGQFVLMINFSFLFMVISGLCYGHYLEQK